jgi:hypothetical protein
MLRLYNSAYGTACDALIDDLNEAFNDDVAACGGDEVRAAAAMGRTLAMQAVGEWGNDEDYARMLLLQAIVQRGYTVEQLYAMYE